ncbi:MAG: protein GlmU [Desulfobacterales bacterium]
MKNIQNSQIRKLMAKGVDVPCPETVFIDADVDAERISGQGVRIYPGCRISGSSTLILAGAQLGSEAPVTLENCQIGPDVSLKGGFFRHSVFLKKASAGSGAHVREGCIFEEGASIAHTVGLKQTILFPFVTLGSLINFCDCLMSGGTGRKDHSEVGSSYIHFNYTPNQDKATASLLGDVPRGVMLKHKPVFLGGQGGLVGPCRLEFGTVIAAGCVWRKDELRPNRLLICGAGRGGSMPFSTGVYQNVKRILVNNFIYIANLAALGQWYAQVRSLFVSETFPQVLLDGLQEKISLGIAERIKRLKELAGKMPGSAAAYLAASGESASASLLAQKKEFHENWPELAEIFQKAQMTQGNIQMRDAFLKTVEKGIREKGKDYIPVIQSLAAEEAESGTCWLQGIVDETVNTALGILPSLGSVR